MNVDATPPDDERDTILRAARREASPTAVVVALAGILRCDLWLLDPGGVVIARSHESDSASGNSLIHDISAQLMPLSFLEHREHELGNWRVRIRPLRSAGSVVNILVAATSRRALNANSIDLLEYGAGLLELIFSSDTAAADARKRNRSDLLDLILAQKINNSHIGWLIGHGFAAGNDLQALILTGTTGSPAAQVSRGADRSSVATSAIDEVLDSTGLTYLSTRAGTHYVVLVSIAREAPAERRGLGIGSAVWPDLQCFAREARAHCGVSLPLRGLSTVPDLLKQALLALQTAAHSTDARDYSELPNLLRLVDALPRETLAYLARRLEPLSGRNDAQSTSRQETLQAFLENDGSIARAAAALHLHPNSLRKRLASIASALGTDLTTTDGITEMRLSVLANQVVTARAALPQAFLADTEPA